MQAREPENSAIAKNFTSLKEIDTFVKQTSDLLFKLALDGKFAEVDRLEGILDKVMEARSKMVANIRVENAQFEFMEKVEKAINLDPSHALPAQLAEAQDVLLQVAQNPQKYDDKIRNGESLTQIAKNKMSEIDKELDRPAIYADGTKGPSIRSSLP